MNQFRLTSKKCFLETTKESGCVINLENIRGINSRNNVQLFEEILGDIYSNTSEQENRVVLQFPPFEILK